MTSHKAVRCLLGAALLGGMLLCTGCEGTQVGVGLGFAVPAPWGGVTVGTTVPVGGWGGGPYWYPRP